jgi:hypothetical protein
MVEDPPPLMLSRADILAQLTVLKEKAIGGYEGYGEEHAWTQMSGLWRLPYMTDLLHPHYIDMMHTEKNVVEALWCTTIEIVDKSKDNIKARLDQASICDRPKYNMKPPKPGKKWKKPSASYLLTRPQRKEILQWFQTLMFPHGYAANLRRGVNLTTMRINGLKSHDYHIWIERLLPVMVRGYLLDHVWQVLAELSYFFRILCAKELSRPLVKKLEDAAPVLLCKLEKIYPPGFSIQCST